MKTKIISLFAIFFSINMLAYDFQVGDLCYNILDNQSVAVTSIVKSPWNSQSNYTLTTAVIPETVTYNDITYTVTSIGKYAFYSSESLKEVTIPQTVTSIENLAFYYCSSLESLTIPNTVVSVGEQAFSECFSMTAITLSDNITELPRQVFSGCSSLASLTIPQGVTSIGEYALEYCNLLESISIPNTVTSISKGAFDSCIGLKSITFPASVNHIGDGVIAGCASIETIVVEEGNTVYDSRDKCNALIETATNTLIVGCKNSVIPTSVTTISDYAFSGCKGLLTIAIPENVTAIGEGVFYNCPSLAAITLHNQLTGIGDYCFFNCTALTSITIPRSLTSIGYSAFLHCPFTSIVVEEGNTIYDSRDNCNALIETATNTLLLGCATSTVPEGIATIYESAFSDCMELTEITLPSTLTTVGTMAFYGCENLTKITCHATTAPLADWGAFYYVPVETAMLYVPQESLESYYAAEEWREFVNILPISDVSSVENVDTHMQQANKSIKNGQLFISRDGKIFNAMGAQMK